MKRIWAGICLIGIVMLLYPVAASADEDSPHGRWWRMPRCSEGLDLTSADKDALDSLFVKNRRALIERKKDLEKERFELENILDRQKLDERAAIEQFKRVEQKREKLNLERFQYLLQVRRILGYERYQKLMETSSEFRGRRGPMQRDQSYSR